MKTGLCLESKHGLLNVVRLLARLAASENVETSGKLGHSNIGHQLLGEIEDLAGCGGPRKIEVLGKVYEIAQVHRFDGDGARCLRCETLLPRRISRIADDQHRPVRDRGACLTRCQLTLVVLLASIKLNPTHLWNCLPQIDFPSCLQFAAGIEQPLTKRFGPSISPAPRVSEGAGHPKMMEHRRLPASKRVIPIKPEDRLHRIADNYGRKNSRECCDHLMLEDGAVLILIDEKARVACLDDVRHVTGGEQCRCRPAYRNISGGPAFENRWVMTGPHRKGLDEPHRPSVDGCESIMLCQDAGTLEPAAECCHASVSVRKDKNRLSTIVSG